MKVEAIEFANKRRQSVSHGSKSPFQPQTHCLGGGGTCLHQLLTGFPSENPTLRSLPCTRRERAGLLPGTTPAPAAPTPPSATCCRQTPGEFKVSSLRQP